MSDFEKTIDIPEWRAYPVAEADALEEVAAAAKANDMETCLGNFNRLHEALEALTALR